MSGKLDKLKQIAKIGIPIAGSIFSGGKAGTILDIVNHTINNPSEPNETALKHLAEVDDALTQVASDHEERIRAIEAKLK